MKFNWKSIPVKAEGPLWKYQSSSVKIGINLVGFSH